MADAESLEMAIRARLDEAAGCRERSDALLAQIDGKRRHLFRNQRLLREAQALGRHVDSLIQMNRLDLIMLRYAR
jgi:hypothetical protein